MKKITLFAALMLMTVLGNAQVDIANGLLAYYPYTGNANDASGNGHNGTVNGPSLTADRFGNSNAAYLLNQNTITSNVPHNFNNDFSYNFWLQADISTMNSGFFSWGEFQNSDFNSYSSLGVGSGEIYTRIDEQDVMNTCDLGASCANTPSGFNSNNWYMLSVTKNGNLLNLYIDTVLVQTSTINDSCNVDLDIYSLRIGNSFPASSFTGKIDDIMLHNRALNAQEIAYLYNLTSSWSASPTSTIVEKASAINIFPNPVSEIANIQFETVGTYLVEVMDITGKVIYRNQTNEQNIQINTSAWAAGIYAVSISNENGLIERKKIVKQ